MIAVFKGISNIDGDNKNLDEPVLAKEGFITEFFTKEDATEVFLAIEDAGNEFLPKEDAYNEYLDKRIRKQEVKKHGYKNGSACCVSGYKDVSANVSGIIIRHGYKNSSAGFVRGYMDVSANDSYKNGWASFVLLQGCLCQ